MLSVLHKVAKTPETADLETEHAHNGLQAVSKPVTFVSAVPKSPIQMSELDQPINCSARPWAIWVH